MRLRWIKGLIALTVWLLAANMAFAEEPAPAKPSDTAAGSETPVLTTTQDLYSYSLGVEAARNYKKLGIDLNLDIIIRGMRDADAGRKLLMTDDEMKSALVEVRGLTVAKQRGDRLFTGLDNQKEGREFLAANKTKEGVVTLKSGLQYKILKAGEGRTPTKEDTVEVYYRGTLLDGTEIENNFDSGSPFTLKVNDYTIIAGIREALKLMPAGSRWQLFIPSKLAYLATGRGIIPPYATLIYEVELVGIK
jgi:FKBP-type peptidyl-prolyl cis-trans isomerase FklB